MSRLITNCTSTWCLLVSSSRVFCSNIGSVGLILSRSPAVGFGQIIQRITAANYGTNPEHHENRTNKCLHACISS